jgi:DNA-binding NtrC family response regulator
MFPPRRAQALHSKSSIKGVDGFLTLNRAIGAVMAEKCSRLLIAERGCELAQGLSSWLTEQGHQCKTVDNIKDVLMTLQNEKINVLVMDAHLPEDMGYEAISIIKGLHRKLPIIITADENNPEQESQIRQKGIFYYHVNSFGLDELILAISNALMRAA